MNRLEPDYMIERVCWHKDKITRHTSIIIHLAFLNISFVSFRAQSKQLCIIRNSTRTKIVDEILFMKMNYFFYYLIFYISICYSINISFCVNYDFKTFYLSLDKVMYKVMDPVVLSTNQHSEDKVEQLSLMSPYRTTVEFSGTSN